MLTEHAAGLGGVEGDLGFEGFQRVQLHFVPEALDETDFDAFAVEVSRVVEEVDFELAFSAAIVLDGGAEAEVGDAFEGFPGDGGLDRIDADRGELLGFEREIGGRKAQLSGKLAALDNGAVDGVVPAKEAGGGREVAALHREAHSGAANGFVRDDDGGEAVDLEAEGLPQSGEGVHVAASVFAEGPVVADGDAAQRTGGGGEGADELVRREGGEGAIKRDDEQMGDAELAEDEAFVQCGGQQSRRGSRAQELHRVGIEGGDDNGSAIGSGRSLGAADDFLVTGMYAIEEPNREMHRSGQGGEIGDGVEGFHLMRRI